MGLIERLTRRKTERLLDELAMQIAAFSYPTVRQRLSPDVEQMSRAEARGYVRARAAAAIRREVTRLLTVQPQVGRFDEAELILRATNQVVQRLTHELFYAQPMLRVGRQAA